MPTITDEAYRDAVAPLMQELTDMSGTYQCSMRVHHTRFRSGGFRYLDIFWSDEGLELDAINAVLCMQARTAPEFSAHFNARAVDARADQLALKGRGAVMQIDINPGLSYLFRPSTLREYADTLEEILAEDNDDRANHHQQRLYQVLDMIEALKQAIPVRKTAKGPAP